VQELAGALLVRRRTGDHGIEILGMTKARERCLPIPQAVEPLVVPHLIRGQKQRDMDWTGPGTRHDLRALTTQRSVSDQSHPAEPDQSDYHDRHGGKLRDVDGSRHNSTRMVRAQVPATAEA
jgi:hypothetical protein